MGAKPLPKAFERFAPKAIEQIYKVEMVAADMAPPLSLDWFRTQQRARKHAERLTADLQAEGRKITRIAPIRIETSPSSMGLPARFHYEETWWGEAPGQPAKTIRLTAVDKDLAEEFHLVSPDEFEAI